jgi:hypothetical protein
MTSFGRILRWAFLVGAVAFAAGFFGPILLAPEANQGPLLGIFITGPLGFIAGALFGFIRELRNGFETPERGSIRGSASAPVANLESAPPALHAAPVRIIAGLGGLGLGGFGGAELIAGAERGAAAAIVLGAVLISVAATGRVPGWFRRNPGQLRAEHGHQD